MVSPLLRHEPIPEVYAREDRPDAAFEEAAAAGAEADFTCLAEKRELARAAAAGSSLDEQFTHKGHGPYSLRRVYSHMIKECARHNGRADLLRQAIDGVTGH